MRKINIIGLVAFTFMVAITIFDVIGNQKTSYLALGGLIALAVCAIIYSLWRIQKMSGVSWKESGERARWLLEQAENDNLPEDYRQTRDLYYDETARYD